LFSAVATVLFSWTEVTPIQTPLFCSLHKKSFPKFTRLAISNVPKVSILRELMAQNHNHMYQKEIYILCAQGFKHKEKINSNNQSNLHSLANQTESACIAGISPCHSLVHQSHYLMP
jgi:hypothetical protein